MDGNSVINVTVQAIYLFGFKILGTIGRLNGLSFPPNLNCPDSFLPPKPPPEKIRYLTYFIFVYEDCTYLINVC